jgi:hypothetical protein
MSGVARRTRIAVLVAGLAVAAGCARVEGIARDAASAWQAQVARPVQYRMAGVDPAVRHNLERGMERLEAGDHRAAADALNRAVWDVERLDDRPLRLAELADVYGALARAYAGLEQLRWADEQRHLGVRVREAAGRAARGTWVQALERARGAYVAARFREALGGFHEALVDLQDVADGATRVRQAEVARCYLALTHFALGDEARLREELRRLAALDASVAACRREAPPSVRALIGDPLPR